MTKTEKGVEWKARLEAWKARGLSVAEWCREEGIKDHQMYYWIRKFEEDTKSTPDVQWLAVDIQHKPIDLGDESIFIHVGQLSIEVRPGTNMTLLSDVVGLLQNSDNKHTI